MLTMLSTCYNCVSQLGGLHIDCYHASSCGRKINELEEKECIIDMFKSIIAREDMLTIAVTNEAHQQQGIFCPIVYYTVNSCH